MIKIFQLRDCNRNESGLIIITRPSNPSMKRIEEVQYAWEEFGGETSDPEKFVKWFNDRGHTQIARVFIDEIDEVIT